MAVAVDAVDAHHRQGSRPQEGGTQLGRDEVSVRPRIDDEGVSWLTREGGVAGGNGEDARRQSRVAGEAQGVIAVGVEGHRDDSDLGDEDLAPTHRALVIDVPAEPGKSLGSDDAHGGVDGVKDVYGQSRVNSFAAPELRGVNPTLSLVGGAREANACASPTPATPASEGRAAASFAATLVGDVMGVVAPVARIRGAGHPRGLWSAR